MINKAILTNLAVVLFRRCCSNLFIEAHLFIHLLLLINQRLSNFENETLPLEADFPMNLWSNHFSGFTYLHHVGDMDSLSHAFATFEIIGPIL